MSIQTFGEWLKKERNRLTLTQQEVAERMCDLEPGSNYSYVTVGDWERNRRRPRPYNLVTLANALAGPGATEAQRANMLKKVRTADAGLFEELEKLERVPDADFVFDTLEAYDGDDPAIIALKEMGKLLREGKRVTKDTPEKELSGQE